MTKKTHDDELSADIFAGGTIEVVYLNELNIDDSYQRQLKAHHKKIFKEFDARACDPLKVARRQDGSLWLIDGQQRKAALLLKGYDKWRAIVIDSSGSAMEAYLFQVAGGGKGTVKPIGPYDIFKAQLTAKDPVACFIQMTAEKYGFKIATNSHRSGYPYIRSPGLLYRLVQSAGGTPFDTALSVIREAWPENENSSSTFVILGMCEFVMYFPNINKERLVNCLQRMSPLTIHQRCWEMMAKQRQGMARVAAEMILERYNKNLKANRLYFPSERPVIRDDKENLRSPIAETTKSK